MSSSQISTPQARIRHLPEAVTSKLRAGVKIVSPTRCVEELVYNAIDAGADCVAVRIDLRSRWKIVVIDNGRGIDETDLQVVGTRYFTSKCSELKDLTESSTVYGYHGEALNNIASVSGLLEITSRPKGSGETYTRSFWHGRTWKFQKAKERRPGRGTTVTVVDFFYNLPVRRHGIKAHLETEYMKHSLERIAVVHPHVSVSLKDEETERTYFSVSKCVSVEQTFLRIFGEEAAFGLKKLKHKKGKIRIEGFIRSRPFSNSNLKLLYVNKSLLRKSHLNQYVDSLLAKGIPPNETAKHPVYILNLRCPYGLYELIQDARTSLVEFGDWTPIQDALKEALDEFFAGLMKEEERRIEDEAVERDEGAESGQEDGEEMFEDEDIFSCAFSPVHQDPTRLILGTENFPPCALPRKSTSMSFKRPPPIKLPLDLKLIPTAMQRLRREAANFAEPCTACALPNMRRRKPISSSASIRAMCAAAPEDWSDMDSDEEIFVQDEKKKSERAERLSRFVNTQKPAVSKKPGSVKPRFVDMATSPFIFGRSESLPSTSSSTKAVPKRPSLPSAEVDRSRSGASEERPSPHHSKADASHGGPSKRRKLGERIRESSPALSTSTWTSHRYARPRSKERSSQEESASSKRKTDEALPYFTDDEEIAANHGERGMNADPRLELEDGGEDQNEHGSEPKPNVELEDDSGMKLPEGDASDDDNDASMFSPPPDEGSSIFSPPPLPEELTEAFEEADENFENPSSPSVADLAPETAPKSRSPAGDFEDGRNSDGELDPDKIDELLRKKLASKERTTRELRQDARAPVPEGETPEAVSFFEREWQNPVFAPDIVAEQGSSGPKDSLSFTKDMLHRVFVLGQADDKFIIATTRDERDVRWLIAIDQHAAHERVRLETFLADYVAYDEGKRWSLNSRAVDPPVKVKLPSRLWKVVQSDPASLRKLGFMWDTFKVKPDSVTVPFLHVPAVFIDRNAREVRKGNVDDIGSLCRQLIEEASEKAFSKGGVASWSIPNTVMDILASRACKGAIKFFDPLTREECAEIVHLLKRCSLPFQCAHGRPSMVPLMNLSGLRQ